MPAVELVLLSALPLKDLAHHDTDVIMVVATTSLPEELGGIRNWDYRYRWLRDAALHPRLSARSTSNGNI
ncbi:hypothetical protein ACIGNX_27520 [Actinosynnema sp. NPDC053489]|uniref:hypothetical protein n=1 Tax=Actinosynnema sp. NPDC053489 TaxID=3363916 RepID=UPI0037C60D90